MSEIEKQEAKGRKRNVQINIRISEAEAEQLRKKVEQSGMSQQEYILSCVLNKPITNTDGIKELIPELKRVGNNLNQIAHALNGGRYYQYNLITDNQKELDKVWQSLKQFLPPVLPHSSLVACISSFTVSGSQCRPLTSLSSVFSSLVT